MRDYYREDFNEIKLFFIELVPVSCVVMIFLLLAAIFLFIIMK